MSTRPGPIWERERRTSRPCEIQYARELLGTAGAGVVEMVAGSTGSAGGSSLGRSNAVHTRSSVLVRNRTPSAPAAKGAEGPISIVLSRRMAEAPASARRAGLCASDTLPAGLAGAEERAPASPGLEDAASEPARCAALWSICARRGADLVRHPGTTRVIQIAAIIDAWRRGDTAAVSSSKARRHGSHDGRAWEAPCTRHAPRADFVRDEGAIASGPDAAEATPHLYVSMSCCKSPGPFCAGSFGS
jgi:hypothetical protein